MEQNETVATVLSEGKRRMSVAGREEHAAELLLRHVLKTDRTGLLIRMRDPIGEQDSIRFFAGITKMAEGVPVQYVTGQEEFYGRVFNVTPEVLIPRPETEELVAGALSRAEHIWPDDYPLRMADIGTGSGAIAVSFKLERTEAVVAATDISPGALQVATDNASRLGAEIIFLEGDMAKPLAGRKWDVVLSNPPYIDPEEAKSMSDTVTGFEPHGALFAEGQGLAHYRTLSETLPGILAAPALIGLEIGHLQGEPVSRLFREAFPEAAVEVVRDINGKDRFVFCELPLEN